MDSVAKPMTGRKRRRHRSVEQKLKVAGETYEPGSWLRQLIELGTHCSCCPRMLICRLWREHYRNHSRRGSRRKAGSLGRISSPSCTPPQPEKASC
jgi:hypothetical protein